MNEDEIEQLVEAVEQTQEVALRAAEAASVAAEAATKAAEAASSDGTAEAFEERMAGLEDLLQEAGLLQGEESNGGESGATWRYLQ